MNIKDYSDFVFSKLSDNSKYTSSYIEYSSQLDVRIQYSTFLTAAIGQLTESIELLSVFDVCYTEKNKVIDELGDVLFYLVLSESVLIDSISNNSINCETEEYLKSFNFSNKKLDDEYLIHYNAISLNGIIELIICDLGKYLDIVKKISFQGKPIEYNILVQLHHILCVVLDHILLLCYKININLDDVMEYNIEKLNKRYKKSFTVSESENRI